jgi:hypothetical protein
MGTAVGTITAISTEISAEHASFKCGGFEEPDDSGSFEFTHSSFMEIVSHWNNLPPISFSHELSWHSFLANNGVASIKDQELFSSNHIIEHLILRASKTKLPLPPFLQGRRFARIDAGESGRLSLVPTLARVGDSAYFLGGGEVPLILRPYAAEGPDAEYAKTVLLCITQHLETSALVDHFVYVGEAFIDGLMTVGKQSARETRSILENVRGQIDREGTFDLIILH